MMNSAFSINFILLNQICIYAHRGDYKELQKYGLPHSQVEQLTSMTVAQLESFSKELGHHFIEINSEYFARCLAQIKMNIPPLCVDYIKYGASNSVMRELLNVSFKSCTSWRRFVDTHPDYRQRSIPADCYLAIWSEIEKLPNPLYPTAEELLVLAKQHAVSIGAIWSDIKKGNDDEKK